MLSFLVHIQTTVKGKGHIAELTLQIFNFLMLRFDVIFQRLFVDECIEALRALIRNTLMFGPYMLNVFMLVTKSRIALLAIELQSPMLGLDMDI